MSGTPFAVAAVLLYLLCGAAIGVALVHRGQAAATALTAVVLWPVCLPLLTDASPPLPRGPFADRIAVALAALENALTDPAAAQVASTADVAALRTALARADARLAMVDRLLAESGLEDDALSMRLASARAHAAGEVESVLRGAIQLRVQVGLVALAGDTLPIRDRLAQLAARARALEEVALA